MKQKKSKNKSRKKSSPIPSPKNAAIGALRPILLPKPRRDSSTTVFEALQERKTVRMISDKKLPLQVLSNLLWAANGVNRKVGPFGIPGRTSASASNSQEIDIYVAMTEGVYLYESVPHRLTPVAAGDLRSLAIGYGQGRAGADAPVRLMYVVDIEKFSKAGFQEPGLWDPEIQKSYYYIDTGLIAGNVYLSAASQGLVTWFHNCNKAGVVTELQLRASQRALFGQTIGYPVKG
jgi:hypothetical protein